MDNLFTQLADESRDVIVMRGCIEMQVRNAFTGEPIGDRIKKNTVVTAGRRWVLERIQSVSPPSNQISHLEIGSITSDAPNVTDTALKGAVSRNTINSYTTSNLTSNPPSWRAECSFASNEGNGTIGEAGLFNSSSAGTMLNRVTFSTFQKTTSNTLSVSMTISN